MRCREVSRSGSQRISGQLQMTCALILRCSLDNSFLPIILLQLFFRYQHKMISVLFHSEFLVSFPITFPETSISRNFPMRGFFRLRKNSRITCRCEVKCRNALYLQAREAVWSNCKRTQSLQANRDFSCVRNMNCCFTHCAERGHDIELIKFKDFVRDLYNRVSPTPNSTSTMYLESWSKVMVHSAFFDNFTFPPTPPPPPPPIQCWVSVPLEATLYGGEGGWPSLGKRAASIIEQGAIMKT